VENPKRKRGGDAEQVVLYAKSNETRFVDAEIESIVEMYSVHVFPDGNIVVVGRDASHLVITPPSGGSRVRSVGRRVDYSGSRFRDSDDPVVTSVAPTMLNTSDTDGHIGPHFYSLRGVNVVIVSPSDGAIDSITITPESANYSRGNELLALKVAAAGICALGVVHSAAYFVPFINTFLSGLPAYAPLSGEMILSANRMRQAAFPAFASANTRYFAGAGFARWSTFGPLVNAIPVATAVMEAAPKRPRLQAWDEETGSAMRELYVGAEQAAGYAGRGTRTALLATTTGIVVTDVLIGPLISRALIPNLIAMGTGIPAGMVGAFVPGLIAALGIVAARTFLQNAIERALKDTRGGESGSPRTVGDDGVAATFLQESLEGKKPLVRAYGRTLHADDDGADAELVIDTLFVFGGLGVYHHLTTMIPMPTE